MQKTDVKELRKEIRKASEQDGIIDWIYGVYVNNENEIIWNAATKFYNFEDEDKFRHLAILNKVLPAGVGKDLIPVEIEQKEDLLNLRNEWDEDKNVMAEKFLELTDTFRENYATTDPYYIMAAHVLYDVPVKASDGAVLEDENTLFNTIVFAVCPAKLSAPALGFEKERVSNLSRRWTIGNPVCGFMYPSMNNRSEDHNEVAVFMKKSAGDEFFNTFFGIENVIQTGNDQKEIWNGILSEMELTTDAAGAINETIAEISAESEAPYIGKEQLKTIVKEAGGNIENFDDVYDEIAGDMEVSAEAVVSGKVEIKTDTAKIQTSMEMASLVKTEMIDGVPYILVPADGVITVNGAKVKI